jgi:hypothetical protein
MIDLERRYGLFSVRVWGLIVNLLANASALYGAARLLRDGSGLGFLVGGVVGTVVCIAVLAIPSRS